MASRRPDTCFVFLRCNYQLKLTGFFESSCAFLTRCFFLFKFPSDIFCGFHIFLVVVVVVRNRNDHDSNSPRYYHYCGAMILFGNRSKSQQAPIELQIAHDQLSYFLILKRLNVYNKHKKKGKKKKRGTRGEYRKKETHTKQVIVNKLWTPAEKEIEREREPKEEEKCVCGHIFFSPASVGVTGRTQVFCWLGNRKKRREQRLWAR